MIDVEVVYATRERQVLVPVQLPRGASLRAAIERAGLAAGFPGLDLATASIGVFGRIRWPDDEAMPGDRIEIYRPLQADPKLARRLRARRRR